jgi:hypothetical protein
MTVRGLLVVLALGVQTEPSTALACHRYAIWRYPTPQRCQTVAGRTARDMARRPQAPSRRVALITPTVGAQGSSLFFPAAPTLDIPLPVLGPVEAVEAAGETRARLMLRAALETP